MLQRIFNWLEYDEVTLFCINYSFLLTVILEFALGRDDEMLTVLLLNPMVLLISGITVASGLWLSLKHIWTKQIKPTTDVFLMIGGGAWLSIATAVFTLFELASLEAPWYFRAPAIYALLYNLLILWFMGHFKGYDIAEEFMAEREAQLIEAIVCTTLVTTLALVLIFVYDWSWWQVVNACVFYTLGANKLVLWMLQARKV